MEKNWVLYYVKKNLFQLILVILSLAIVTMLNVMVADNLRNITDSIIVKGWEQIKHYLLLLGVVILCGFIFQFFNQYLIGRWSSRCLVDLREKFSNVLLNVTIEKLNSTKGGNIISVFTNDLRTVYVFLKVHLVKFLSQVFMVIFSFIYLFFINKLVTLAIIVIVPVVILVTNYFTKSIQNHSRSIQKNVGEANIVLQDSFKGYQIVKSFNLETCFKKKYSNIISNCIDDGISIDRKVLKMEYIVTMFQILPYILFCLLGGFSLQANLISIGELIAFLNLFDYLYMSLTEMQYTISDIRVDVPSIERLNEILNYPIEEEICMVIDEKCSLPEEVIRFENVTFSYNRNVKALEDVSFKITEGKKYVIFGESGSGKSTIFQLLCKFQTDYEGEIFLFGKNIRTWNFEELRKKISIVSQDVYLFPVSIKENISCGNNDVTELEIIEAAKMANAHKFISNLPNGYDTILQENGRNLSGGEKQRISIARAIIKNSPILLLDEATSALDALSSMKVENAIENLICGKTTLKITHKVETIKPNEDVIFISDGAIKAKGKHGDLASSSHLYKSLVETNHMEQASYGGDIIHGKLQ